MACGTPVVAAPEPTLREVAGDAAIFTDDLADGVRRALADRDRLSAAGLERARGFSWQETARLTADVYRDVLSS
jgi:glycosyltransferase involved in cell wall biosynthesis